ncbi:MAG: hypothetical protein KIT31_17810 [Deltaproteobacteria bacterium]|nr:hypothetical protein [Deltaproteobacteria bacterium]
MLALVACSGGDKKPDPAPPGSGPAPAPARPDPKPGETTADKPPVEKPPEKAPDPPPPPEKLAGHEFLEDAKLLLVVGACADGTQSVVKPEIVEAHCKKVKAAQDEYKKSWLAAARDFFSANVPKNLPRTVVYPFAGGDLGTALTVYPDADEITTLSLEPAGDARALAKLSEKDVVRQLNLTATELASLYRANFSVTMRMIDAMTVSGIPTQLIFSLSALSIHDYELVSLRYFKLDANGDPVYLEDKDLAEIDKIKTPVQHNKEMANVELRFRKKGSSKTQVYRHLLANLNDGSLKTTPAPLRHLEKKGKVAGMTKAASYLLTFDEFATMRKYLAEHVEWMVSDSTGLPPSAGEPAGFEYEMWGQYDASNMKEGARVTPAWKKLYAAQPKRDLKFRFGYPSFGNDGKMQNHLIIARRTAKK